MDNYKGEMDNIFGALSDATRRAIVMRLCAGEASVGELARPFNIALPNLMKHVRILESCGIIETQKIGRVRTCRLQMARLESIDEWLASQREIWNQRLDRLEIHVEKMMKEEKSNDTKNRRK